MRKAALIRIGARLAIAGGALRAAASFAPIVIASDRWRESLYVVVDSCLSVGLIGFYSQRSKGLGCWGRLALAIALTGIATVRANRVIFAADLYPAGALAIACGVLVLAVRAWVVNDIHGWIPAAFICSMLVGIAGTAVQGGDALFVCSGVMFGLAFGGLGVEMLTSASS